MRRPKAFEPAACELWLRIELQRAVRALLVDPKRTAKRLIKLARYVEPSWAAWLCTNARALATGTFDALGDGFAQREFVSSDGYFFIAAPFRALHSGKELSQLSVIC